MKKITILAISQKAWEDINLLKKIDKNNNNEKEIREKKIWEEGEKWGGGEGRGGVERRHEWNCRKESKREEVRKEEGRLEEKKVENSWQQEEVLNL